MTGADVQRAIITALLAYIAVIVTAIYAAMP